MIVTLQILRGAIMDIGKYANLLASTIKDAIEQSGKSMGEVAQCAGIPWSTFFRRLNQSDRYPFTVSDVVAISEVLDIDFLQLMKEAERRYKLAA